MNAFRKFEKNGETRIDKAEKPFKTDLELLKDNWDLENKPETGHDWLVRLASASINIILNF